MRFLVAVVASAVLSPAVAAAQPAPPAAPPEGASPLGTPPAPMVGPPPPMSAPAPRRPAVLSATITPLALPWEILELTAPNMYAIVAVSLEVRAHPKLGIAIVGLAGDKSDDSNDFVRSRFTFFEAGFEPRWYPRGGFRGWMVGAALHYFRMHMVLTDINDDFGWPYDFAGYTYGPFVGYKYTAPIGFTFEAKLGWEAITRTMSDAGPHPVFLPIMDAKVGWSF